MNKVISVDELVEMVKASKSSKQKKPVIVWFENVSGDILKYASFGEPYDLAVSLSEADDEIAFNRDAGSPLTDYDKCIDGDKVRNITDEERYAFIIPSCVKISGSGELITKVYLHSPIIPYIGEKGLNSIQFAEMVHDKLNLPVFLLFPLKWKEKMNADFSAFDEILCSDELENVKDRWLKRVAGKNENGYQIVDSFFLDFLKTAPNELLTREFDKGQDDVVYRRMRYEKWEELSKRLREELEIEIVPLSCGENSNKEMIQEKYNLLFTDGNLNFDALRELLEQIPKEVWEKWYNENHFELEINKVLNKESNRLDVIKSFLVSDSGSFPENATIELLKFHNLA
ncbi:MAG: hypothetical protein J1F12_09065 [Muribaculaceae bacterium]|nr:hypothetical protein [Muribaculaceae bacterium]